MKSTIKYLTDEEIARLFRAIDSERDQAIFRVAYHRGLRASEVALLNMDDLRLDVGRLFVHRLKCRSVDTSGEYVLIDAELKAIKRWLKIRGVQPGPIFTSNRGTGISRKMLDVLMKGYCAAARIPADKAHFHSLRHTCATHLLSEGEEITIVQDHLGHVNISNTMVYAKITNRRRDEAARRLKGWK